MDVGYPPPMPIPRLKSDSALVLVIDVQDRLLPTIVDSHRVVTNNSLLITMAETLGMPYLVTEQYPQGLGRTSDAITAAMADQSQRIEKTQFSAAVDLVQEHLLSWSRSQVIIGGLEAHVCVLQTVLDLQQSGRQCFVCSDAISSAQRDQIEPAMHRMRQSGAIITGVISSMYEMMGSATHPAFRSCLDIAKMVEM